MVLVFVSGLDAFDSDASALASSFSTLADAPARWLPLVAAAEDSPHVRAGIVDVGDPHGAARILRACESLKDAIAMADSQSSSQCMRAAAEISDESAALLGDRLKAALRELPRKKHAEKSREEMIQDAMRLEPRQDSVSDELWTRIKEFRERQAEEEVQQDVTYKDAMKRMVADLRARRAREAMELEVERKAKIEGEVQRESSAEAREEGEIQEAERDGEKEAAKEEGEVLGRFSMKIKAPRTRQRGEGNAEELAEEDEEDAASKRRKFIPTEFEKGNGLTELEIKSLIEKRVVEYLGQGDESFSNHVFSLMMKDTGKDQLVAEVTAVLDDDSEAFADAVIADVRRTSS